MSGDNQTEISESSLITGTVELIQSRFVWLLSQKSLTDISKYKYGIKSPEFTTKLDNNFVKWGLSLIVHNRDAKEYVCLLVRCLSQNKLKATIKMTFKNAFSQFSIERSNIEFVLDEWNSLADIKKDQLINQNTMTNNDKCMLVCTITTSSQHTIKLLSEINCFLQFREIINKKQFSDVVLCVKGKEFYAYKGILSSRSTVFKAMFAHNTTELNSSRVEISDVNYDTMYMLLQYMYTDYIPQYQNDGSQKKCKNLLIAADKYDLPKLQRKMQENLVANIQVDNVFEFLSFADLYNAPYLKVKAIEFILSIMKRLSTLNLTRILVV